MFRAAFFSIAFAAVFAASPATAQPPSGPGSLPPGVTVLASPPAALSMPVDIGVDAIQIDWTHPLLRVRVESGLAPEAGIAERWDDFAAARPGSFLIQLAEPLRGEVPSRLALGADLPPPAPRRAQREAIRVDPEPAPTAAPGAANHVRAGGIAPWILDGPALRAAGEPASPLIEGSARVDVRWLGRVEDWRRSPPDLILTDRMILSLFDPVSGRGWFVLLTNRSVNRALPLSRLTEWLEAAFAPHVWAAAHAAGPQSIIGQGAWRLGTLDERTGVERAGAVLVLRAAGPGEPIDWARLGTPRLKASSYARDFPPERVTDGLLWPVPFAPPVWESRSTGSEAGRLATLEVELPAAREIEVIRLIYGGAAGWSSHFNPAQVRLVIRGTGRGAGLAPIVIENPPGDTTTVRFDRPTPIESVRIEFTRPSRSGLPEPARLMAVQLIGPPSR